MPTIQESQSTILDRKRAANAYLPRLAEGIVRREIGLDDLCDYFRSVAHLYSVGIDVNAICNLRCGYCYLDKYNRETAPNYVDLDCLFAFLDQVIEAEVDVIALVGKEPFADDRGIQVLNHLHRRRTEGCKFRYGVVTNGTLLDRYMDQLPSTISYIDISLDGNEQKTELMRGRGVFEKATHSLREVTARGFDTWVSSVLYAGASEAKGTVEFMRQVSEETGCSQFYLSPIRNFTGQLAPHLVSFGTIQNLQARIGELADNIASIKRIILDHPYESVWRDYFIPVRHDHPSRLQEIQIDEFGNLLHQMSRSCFRKLDVFPHGPWGTCRVDATGAYLSDVEARTFAAPRSAGNIMEYSSDVLHSHALECDLWEMMSVFLRNMFQESAKRIDGIALVQPTLGCHPHNSLWRKERHGI